MLCSKEWLAAPREEKRRSKRAKLVVESERPDVPIDGSPCREKYRYSSPSCANLDLPRSFLLVFVEQVYFRVWRGAEGPYLEKVEMLCLQASGGTTVALIHESAVCTGVGGSCRDWPEVLMSWCLVRGVISDVSVPAAAVGMSVM